MEAKTKYKLAENNFQVNDESVAYDANKYFISLGAWKKAKEVKIFFNKTIIPSIPIEQKNNLGFQIRKIAICITANIAEGYGRFYNLDAIRFYSISRESQFELKNHLISCFDLNFVIEETYNNGFEIIEQSKRFLN